MVGKDGLGGLFLFLFEDFFYQFDCFHFNLFKEFSSKYFFASSIRRGMLGLFSLLLFFSRIMRSFLQLRSLSLFTRIRAV